MCESFGSIRLAAALQESKEREGTHCLTTVGADVAMAGPPTLFPDAAWAWSAIACHLSVFDEARTACVSRAARNGTGRRQASALETELERVVAAAGALALAPPPVAAGQRRIERLESKALPGALRWELWQQLAADLPAGVRRASLGLYTGTALQLAGYVCAHGPRQAAATTAGLDRMALHRSLKLTWLLGPISAAGPQHSSGGSTSCSGSGGGGAAPSQQPHYRATGLPTAEQQRVALAAVHYLFWLSHGHCSCCQPREHGCR